MGKFEDIKVGDVVILNTLGCAEGEDTNWVKKDRKVDWTKPLLVEHTEDEVMIGVGVFAGCLRVVGGGYWHPMEKFGLVKRGEGNE